MTTHSQLEQKEEGEEENIFHKFQQTISLPLLFPLNTFISLYSVFLVGMVGSDVW